MSKKRATVEGNIRKRKDVLWEGRYTARYDQTRKRIIKNILGKTHKPRSRKKGLDQKTADRLQGRQNRAQYHHRP